MSGAILPREIFENLHSVVAILALFDQFLGKFCLNFLPLNLSVSSNMMHFVGMCLEENYSDSPSNEYARHYSAESEYLRRQNMNSKLGEEQKKKKVITSVEVLISTQIRIKSKKKVKMIMV